MCDSGGLPPRTREGRAQSETLGIILVFGMVLAGATTVVVFGAAAIGDSEQRLSVDRAEKVLTQMDSEASLVALGATSAQKLSFYRGQGEQFTVENGTGWMRVNITNQTSDVTRTLMKQPMGEVRYASGNTTIAYQGGGVWRKGTGQSQMVSPPEFHYRNATLTLPLVSVTGDSSIGRRAYITKNGSTERMFPDAPRLDQWTNPLGQHQINVSVKSDYYRAWGQYFETRTDGDVTYDHDDDIAHVLLTVPPDNPAVQGGIVSGAAGTTLVVKNGAKVDSYNSSNAQYGTFPDTSNTRIIAAGDLSIRNNAEVYGNVEVGESLEIDNNGELHDGNISYGTSVFGGGWDGNWFASRPPHWQAQNASVESPDSVSTEIEARVDILSEPSNNDNTDPPINNPTSPTPTLETCPCTLTAGDYYLDAVDITSGQLEFDTSGGSINITVAGDFNVDDTGASSDVAITGNNRVNLFVGGNVHYDNNAKVGNADDNASQFWTYVHPDADVIIMNGGTYKGVIYGPGNAGNEGANIEIEQNAEIFGSLVGSVTFVSNGIMVHYDEALQQTETIKQIRNLPALTYLHVSVNRIHVTS